MIVRTISSVHEFIAEFEACNRSSNFSVYALEAMFEFLNTYSEEHGEPIELDVIALCCEFTEYENIAECDQAYGCNNATIEELNNHTYAFELPNGGVLVMNY